MVWGFDGHARLGPWLRRCFAWRLVAGWYGLAFLGPPVILLAALALHLAFGGILPASPAAGHFGLTLLRFAVVLFVGGPVREEFGWRGFALPSLVPRFGWRLVSLIVGAIMFFKPGPPRHNRSLRQ